MRLQYEIAAVGQQQLSAVLRGVEREMMASNRRMMSAVGTSASRAAKQRPSDIARGFGEIAKAAQAADRQQYRERIRLEKATERERLAGIKRTEREAIASARREAQARASAERAAKREAHRAAFARQRMVHSMSGGAARTVMATGGRIASGVGSVLGIAGGFAAANAIHEDMAIRAGASRLANQAGTPEIKGELAAEARQLRGFTGEEALAGLEAFADVTGDLDSARALLGDLGKVALATGTDIRDLGAMAGNAFIPLVDQIKDPAQRLERLRDIIGSVAGMGAEGAVEVKHLASEMAGLAAASRKFEGDSGDLIKTAAAMAQAARQRGGAATASEAVTAVSRFTTDLIGNQDRFGKAGLNVFADAGKTQLKNPQEIMVAMLEKTGGDLSKINKLFGVFAERAVAGFAPIFTDAERQQKGSGAAAVRKEFSRFLSASVSREEIEQRATSRLNDPDLQLKESMKDLNAVVARELTPALTRAIPSFGKLIPHIGDAADALAKFIDFAHDNPFQGLGALFAGMLAKEAATAGIGKALEATIARALGGVASPGVPGGVGAAATSSLLLTGAVTITAVGGVMLASDQASKLDKETGGEASKAGRRVLASLPGFDKSGEFSIGELFEDHMQLMTDPGGFIKAMMKGAQGVEGDLRNIGVNAEGAMDAAARSDANARRQSEADAAIAADAKLRAELGLSTQALSTFRQELQKVRGLDPARTGVPIAAR